MYQYLVERKENLIKSEKIKKQKSTASEEVEASISSVSLPIRSLGIPPKRVSQGLHKLSFQYRILLFSSLNTVVMAFERTRVQR